MALETALREEMRLRMAAEMAKLELGSSPGASASLLGDSGEETFASPSAFTGVPSPAELSKMGGLSTTVMGGDPELVGGRRQSLVSLMESRMLDEHLKTTASSTSSPVAKGSPLLPPFAQQQANSLLVANTDGVRWMPSLN